MDVLLGIVGGQVGIADVQVPALGDSLLKAEIPAADGFIPHAPHALVCHQETGVVGLRIVQLGSLAQVAHVHERPVQQLRAGFEMAARPLAHLLQLQRVAGRQAFLQPEEFIDLMGFIGIAHDGTSGDGKSCCIRPFLWVLRASSFWVCAAMSSSRLVRHEAMRCCSALSWGYLIAMPLKSGP